jgi:hypothetical protein
MTYLSNLIQNIAKDICRCNHCSGLFDDLCQIGALTADKLAHKSSPYIAISVRRAMLKAVPQRQPESLGDRDYADTRGIDLSPEFYINDLIASDQERSIFIQHYLYNVSVDKIAEATKMSVSAIYRILSRLRKDLVNAI